MSITETKDDEQRETGKFYSAARSFKQLLGVTPDGTSIPGGPYTVTQFVLGLAVLAVGFLSRPLWGDSLLQDAIYIGAATVGVIFVTGKIPSTRRNPFKMVQAVWRLLRHSRQGVYRGRPADEVLPRSSWKNVARKDKEKSLPRAGKTSLPRGQVKKGEKKKRRGRSDASQRTEPTQIPVEGGQPAGHPSLGRLRAGLGLTGQD